MLFLSKFRIEGHSMEPVLKNDEKVLASYIPYLFKNPAINDIIVFKISGNFFIKRIKEKNGNTFFVEGDNKKDSLDSKKFGKILQDQIVAKIVYKL